MRNNETEPLIGAALTLILIYLLSRCVDYLHENLYIIFIFVLFMIAVVLLLWFIVRVVLIEYKKCIIADDEYMNMGYDFLNIENCLVRFKDYKGEIYYVKTNDNVFEILKEEEGKEKTIATYDIEDFICYFKCEEIGGTVELKDTEGKIISNKYDTNEKFENARKTINNTTTSYCEYHLEDAFKLCISTKDKNNASSYYFNSYKEMHKIYTYIDYIFRNYIKAKLEYIEQDLI